MSKIKKISLSALLLALEIILSRFLSIKTPILVISFGFLPIMISAILLGPKFSFLIATLADLIGALLFPFGEYFIGFTIIQGLTGLVYGIFLYNKEEGKFYVKKKMFKRLLISEFLVIGVIELCLTSSVLHFLYGQAFLVIFETRVVAKAIMFPIQLVIVMFLMPYIRKLSQKYLFN